MDVVLARGAAEKPRYSRSGRLKSFLDQARNGEWRFGLRRAFALLEITFDVLSKHIAFEIDRVAGPAVADVGVQVGVGNHGDFGDVVVPACDGEADAVNCDRALWHDVASEFFRNLHAKPPVFTFGIEMRYAADGVHVAENEVSAEFLARGQWLLKVDARAFFQFAILCAKRSLANRFTG